MGSKSQRQNQHVNRLMRKIEKFKRKGQNTSGLERELAYCAGEKSRPEFKTGKDVDPRLKRRFSHG